MKVVKITKVACVLCPITKEYRPARDCMHCDSYEGFITDKYLVKCKEGV